MTSAMKTNLTSISLTSLLVLLAATAAGLTGASIPAAFSAETMLATFGAAGALSLFFLDYAPVIFTSAKSGFNLDRLLEAIRYVAAQLQQKIPTGLLNLTLQDAVETRQPVSAAR